ncbi:MAG: GNAT family N-acetyltransferase [Planctomycetes bacterium]|nr:GNAT family N-acetyltransferase [Planctomycetota bacterium]
MTQIRKFQFPSDVPAFKTLNFRTFRDSIPASEPVDEAAFEAHYQWLLKQFTPFDADKSVIWVAEVDGVYAGHLWLGTQVDFFTKRADPWIFDLSVLSEHRRMGIARELHDMAIEYLKEIGHKRIALQVMAHNTGAAKLYEGLGYKPRASSLFREL